jgi:hypothetical protein
MIHRGPAQRRSFFFATNTSWSDPVETYYDYLRTYAPSLGSRIVEMYPPLQGPNDPIAAPIATLLRKPLPAQALTISGLAKALNSSRSVRIVGECGTGKTLMSIGVGAHTCKRSALYRDRDVSSASGAQMGTRGAHHRAPCSRFRDL